MGATRTTENKWYVEFGLQKIGPYQTALEAEKWATKNLPRGQTYNLTIEGNSCGLVIDSTGDCESCQ